jgi:hypothetical protein
VILLMLKSFPALFLPLPRVETRSVYKSGHPMRKQHKLWEAYVACLFLKRRFFLFDFLSVLLIRELCNQFVDVVIPLPNPIPVSS